MKRTGLFMAIGGTVLFLAAGFDLFGDKHLPVPLTVSGLLLGVVSAFLGPAIYVLTFAQERRKKITKASLIVSLSLIAVGLACVYLHLLGARLEIMAGVLTFCFFYGTLAFKSKYEKWKVYARSKRDALFLSLFDFLGIAMLFLGWLFEFQQWHLGKELMTSGFVVLVIGMFFWNQKFKKEVIYRKETEDKLQQSYREIEQKQKEITDSITYARRIQHSLLANDEFMQKNLPEHFVLYLPKDIVSGDFYWGTLAGDAVYLAVCDCTGHGVPGAFMSLLNISFLNEAINEKKITEPHLILNYVRKKLIENISQSHDDSGGGKDGMDGILIRIQHATGTVTYAASNNAPVFITASGVVECAADKMPVGKGEHENSFTSHQLNPAQGDVLYLITDGFADQFGGERGKKFKRSRLKEKLEAIRTQPVNIQQEALKSAFLDWRGRLEQVDDVCIIGIRF